MTKATTPMTMPAFASADARAGRCRGSATGPSRPSPTAIGPRITPNADEAGQPEQQRGDGVAVALEQPATELSSMLATIPVFRTRPAVR